MNFSALKLSALILKAIEEEGYTKPTAVQSQAIPAILEGRDVMAAAQTGTGKTAGFTLPILELLAKGEPVGERQVRTLVLTPTRELAAQVANSIATYGKHLELRYAVVFGGVKINPQMSALRKGVDILVATPGRLLDLYNQKSMKFDQLEILVLDEADRMLDMGFIHYIKKIMSILPKKRQNLMFSATFSTDIRALAKGLMHNAVEISVTPPNTTVKSVEQFVYTVDKKQKMALLSHIIWEGRWEQVLIFTRTKHGANRLAQQLEIDGIDAVAIHGNKSQGARTKALANFKAGKVRALVATDIAARGLDIELLPHVVNYDLPQITEDYIHRIGRTGRAGATGQAISLVSADEARQLADIEKLIKQKFQRKVIDNFEPKHTVPEARVERSVISERSERPRAQSRERSKEAPRTNTRTTTARTTSAKTNTARTNTREKTKPAVRYRERDSDVTRSDSRSAPRRDSRDDRDSRRSDSRKETPFGVRGDARRSDSRKDFRPSSPRRDSRDDTRSDSRKDFRSAPRKDSRDDSRGDSRKDFRPASPRRDSRDDTRSDSRKDFRSAPRKDSRDDSRTDSRKDFRPASPRGDSRRTDSRSAPRRDSREDSSRDERSFDPRKTFSKTPRSSESNSDSRGSRNARDSRPSTRPSRSNTGRSGGQFKPRSR